MSVTPGVFVGTVHNPPSPGITLRPPFVSAREALTSLGETMTRYADWEDPLSRELYSRGLTILKTATESTTAATAAKVANLLDILQNSLDETIALRDPYVAGGELWEGWMLRGYMSACINTGRHLQSPLDEDQSLENFLRHDYAREILELVSRTPHGILTLDHGTNRSENPLDQSEFESYPDWLKIFVIQQMARTTRAKRGAQASQERQTELRERRSGTFSQAVTEIRERVQAMGERFERSAEEMRNTYQTAEHAMRDRQDIVENNLREAEAENQRNTELLQRAEARIRELQACVNALAGEDRDSGCSIL